MAYDRSPSAGSQPIFSAGSGSPDMEEEGESPFQTEQSTDNSESQQSNEEASESSEDPDLQSAKETLQDADYDNTGCTLSEAQFRAVLKKLQQSKDRLDLQSAKTILQTAGPDLTNAEASAVLIGIITPQQQSSTSSSDKDPMDSGYPLDLLILLGDYAGRLWKCLRRSAAILNIDLPDRVGDLHEALSIEHNLDDPWTQDLQLCANHACEGEDYEANLRMARLAIDVYAARNVACHVKIGDPRIAHDPRMLNRAIDENIEELHQILPDSLKESSEDMVALMNFYRDSRDRLVEHEDRDESHHKLVPTELPPSAETSDAFRGRWSGYESPVKSRSVSPSKRTASGSLKLARDDASTSFRPLDPIDKGFRAFNGIREDIAKLESKGNDSRAIEAIERARVLLQETLSVIEGEQAVMEGSPRKRARG